jgi:subtilisin family serine protease
MKLTVYTSIAALTLLPAIAHATESSVPFIHADQVHAMGITGFGVTVAVIDTGVDYADPARAADIAGGGVTFKFGGPEFDGGVDPFGAGHGTYMSLIITDPTGVAPDAKILPIRVGSAGAASPEDVVLGIEYATRRRLADSSIRVINVSLGSGAYQCDCDRPVRSGDMGRAVCGHSDLRSHRWRGRLPGDEQARVRFGRSQGGFELWR